MAKAEDDAARAAEDARVADEARAAEETRLANEEAAKQAALEAAKDAAKTEDQKALDRTAYELRKERERREAVEKENADYKRRDEDARKAKLTEEQRVAEERDELKARLEKLEGEKLQARIASEYRLPPALADRIRGTDEAAMRADAEELSKLVVKTRVGQHTDPVKETNNSTAQSFKRSQLRDPAFFNANKAAIDAAAAAGRITEG